MSPTVLAGVSGDAALRHAEIFGPVAPVSVFDDEDEAVAAANDTEFGLVAYVYTRDLNRALRVCERLETGMVGLNQGVVSNPAAPFGGVKASGLGRRHGREGILKYTESQNITVQSLVGVGDIPGLKGERYGKALTGALRLMKAVRLP